MKKKTFFLSHIDNNAGYFLIPEEQSWPTVDHTILN